MPDLALFPAAGLSVDQLARRCSAAEIPFESTAEVDAAPPVVAQERAAAAIAYGIEAPFDDCNIFAMGPPGIGKRSMILAALRARALSRPPPSDWVYVNNLADPRQPIAIELAPGRGAELKRDMERLVDELRTGIPALFESEDYSHRVEKIDTELNERRDKAIAVIASEAERQGVNLVRTPAGFAFIPVKDGEPIRAEDFDKLPEEERERIAAAIAKLQEDIEKVVREALRDRKERMERVRAVNRDMVMLVVGQRVEELLGRYAGVPKAVAYLQAVQRDTLENAELFRRTAEAPEGMALLAASAPDAMARRYQVNVLVDRSAAAGAEVVFCDHPTYANLVGRIEHVQHLGSLVTDFTLLKCGDLHRANGGYLVIDALKLLTQPFAWEALKRALERREILVEPVDHWWGLSSTVSLSPEPIPLATRVVLVGERRLYYLLEAFDPEFPRFFKVVADFDEALDRDGPTTTAFALMIAGLVREDRLQPFDRRAVARVIDEASRRAGDARKLSADRASVRRLLREADHLSRRERESAVSAAHVAAAVRAQRERSARLSERMGEAIERGFVLIDTTGRKVGQVNGLALIDIGEYPFAEPVRITATTRLGDGEVVDIEREARLGGAIHSKGVMILSQFLAARFSATRPLSLAASLVFEQTYGTVEGDSASLAELCALLSSLAGTPVRQSLAVTGSVNQRGEVQAIGGVNEKIEGFFDICARRGLTGEQGVIIPAANAQHLMLREDVVDAVAQGRFHVHAVDNVDDALERLMGIPAGAADAAAADLQSTVNGRVLQRLLQFARLRTESNVKAVLRQARSFHARKS